MMFFLAVCAIQDYSTRSHDDVQIIPNLKDSFQNPKTYLTSCTYVYTLTVKLALLLLAK